MLAGVIILPDAPLVAFWLLALWLLLDALRGDSTLFTRSDGSYLAARWGRPLAPVVFGVDDALDGSRGRWRALLALLVSGTLTIKEALAGFSAPVVLLIASLFFVGWENPTLSTRWR